MSRFLQENLNRRVSADAWKALLQPPWGTVGPNRGFQLRSAGRVVGAYAAVYSSRGHAVDVCNLAAFCVLEDFRSHSLLLVRALLRQRGYLFTDLSPSGNVPAMNERLGFRHLDTSTRLVANLPHPARGVEISDDPAMLEATLTGAALEVYLDHRGARASRHLLVRDGDRYAYLLYRRDRRKRLPVFAAPLHVAGDTELLASAWRGVASHLLRNGFLATLAERRVLGFTPGGIGRSLRNPRTKMFKPAETAAAGDIDYLYSELTLLEW
ncbi:hypothetical protein ACLKM7_07675 [Microbacterium sp. I2]|uniref:hypothetical protein n=1 Tax=Microbacterium sp. I2 TaxID=3391826 RepID=UPI003EDAE42C